MQRAFLSPDGKLWYSHRDPEGSLTAPEPRTPNGAFWLRNYYTILDGEAPTDFIEKQFYSNLDNYLGQVVPELLGVLEDNKIPSLEIELEDQLKEMVFRMALRTPDFADHDDKKIGRRYLEDLISTASGSSGLNEIVEKATLELGDGAKEAAYGRDIRVRATLGDHPRSREELRKRSIRWVRAPERCSFILSSRMALRIGNGGSNGLANPNSEIWMPISPKFCLILLIDTASQIRHLNHATPTQVREMNEYAARYSWAIGSHSEKLVRSLTRKRK